MPRMHPQDYVVIIKPAATADLRNTFRRGELGKALNMHLGISTAANTLTIVPAWEQNLLVVGTQNPHLADRLLGDFNLSTTKGVLPVHGHLKLTGDVCRGVIGGIADEETSTTLTAQIDWRGGKIANIRRLGKSSIAVITFVGKVVPQYVHYNGELTPVREYKRTVPSCIKCGTVGHRADTCPTPNSSKCGLCRQTVTMTQDGPAQHECNPTCAICAQAHPTGSRECTARFRRLHLAGAKASEKEAYQKTASGNRQRHPAGEANGNAPRHDYATGSREDDINVASSSLEQSSTGKKKRKQKNNKKKQAPSTPPSGIDAKHFPALNPCGAAGARRCNNTLR